MPCIERSRRKVRTSAPTYCLSTLGEAIYDLPVPLFSSIPIFPCIAFHHLSACAPLTALRKLVGTNCPYIVWATEALMTCSLVSTSCIVHTAFSYPLHVRSLLLPRGASNMFRSEESWSRQSEGCDVLSARHCPDYLQSAALPPLVSSRRCRCYLCCLLHPIFHRHRQPSLSLLSACLHLRPVQRRGFDLLRSALSVVRIHQCHER